MCTLPHIKTAAKIVKKNDIRKFLSIFFAGAVYYTAIINGLWLMRIAYITFLGNEC